MRDDQPAGPYDDGQPKMLLLAINQMYWLADGDKYINAMLKGDGFFPTPIICVIFSDANELREFIGPDRNVTDYWGINPDVVERLRRDNHLKEIFAHDL